MKPAFDLLYDSEASLRLVDRAIGDLSPAFADGEPSVPPLRQHLEQSLNGPDQIDALLDEYASTTAIVVRFCETAGMLDANALSPLRPTPRHLRAVSVKTAEATAAILDGLARAVSLVDALDGRVAVSDERRHATTESLREELNAVADHLQHQEITAQQLAHIESLFGDLRSRITQVVSIFSPPVVPGASIVADASPHCDARSAAADAVSFRNAH